LIYVVQSSLREILGNGQKYIKDGKDVMILVSKSKNYWGIEEDADAIPRSSDGQLFLMEMVSKMKSLSQSPQVHCLRS
jgi:type I restriction enzyme M protein